MQAWRYCIQSDQFAVSYCIISCIITSHQSHCIVSYCVMPSSYLNVSCHMILHHIIPYHMILCMILLYCIVWLHALKGTGNGKCTKRIINYSLVKFEPLNKKIKSECDFARLILQSALHWPWLFVITTLYGSTYSDLIELTLISWSAANNLRWGDLGLS